MSRSSAEAEYRAVAHAVAECCWLRQLLLELHRPLPSATVVFCDNVSAVYMACNPVQIRVLHMPSSQQFADVMTKGLPSHLFEDFRYSLCVRPTHKLRGDVKV